MENLYYILFLRKRGDISDFLNMRTPDLAAIIGIAGAIGFILFVIIFESVTVKDVVIFFWSPGAHSAWFIVLGGTIMATIAGFTRQQLAMIVKSLRVAFFEKGEKREEIIRMFIEYARRVRREGIRAAEVAADESEHPFMKKGFNAIAEGLDPQTVERLMDAEIEMTEERHKIAIKAFDFAAMLAPSFGLIGAVTGLVRTLVNLEDPSKVGPGVALAFVATFYGILTAYAICYPIKNKLEMKHKEEMSLLLLIKEGVVSISKGESHLTVREKLLGYLEPERRGRFEELRPS